MQLGAAQVNWFSTYRVHHRVAPRFREGRAFLLGDAAHVHSPVGGQGMNTGIGDAINLAWKLAAVLKGEAGAAILDTYEPERIAFARRLVETTDRGFTIVTRQGRLARLVRTRLVPAIAPAVFRIPAMRRLFFRTVSQINVSYHDSALSEGKTGVKGWWSGVVRRGIAGYWYMIAAAIPLVITFTAAGLNVLLGAQLPTRIDWTIPFQVLPVMLLLSGMWEEPGWTGFALPRLFERFGPSASGTITATMVMALIRTVSGPALPTSRPRSRQAAITSAAGRSTSAAISRPRPRVSVTPA